MLLYLLRMLRASVSTNESARGLTTDQSQALKRKSLSSQLLWCCLSEAATATLTLALLIPQWENTLTLNRINNAQDNEYHLKTLSFYNFMQIVLTGF